MSKALIASELRGLSCEQLNTKVVGLKEGLFGPRPTAATEQLESHGRFREVYKNIARTCTVLQECNLGIVDEPAIQEK